MKRQAEESQKCLAVDADNVRDLVLRDSEPGQHLDHLAAAIVGRVPRSAALVLCFHAVCHYEIRLALDRRRRQTRFLISDGKNPLMPIFSGPRKKSVRETPGGSDPRARGGISSPLSLDRVHCRMSDLAKHSCAPTPTDVLVPHPQLAESRRPTSDALCKTGHQSSKAINNPVTQTKLNGELGNPIEAPDLHGFTRRGFQRSDRRMNRKDHAMVALSPFEILVCNRRAGFDRLYFSPAQRQSPLLLRFGLDVIPSITPPDSASLVQPVRARIRSINNLRSRS